MMSYIHCYKKAVAWAVKREEQEALRAIRSFARERKQGKLKALRGSLADRMG
jgi:hypothetical protein